VFRGTILYLFIGSMIIWVILIKVKAVYGHNILRPKETLDLNEGEEVEIEVKKSITDMTFGVIQLDPDVIDEIIEDTEHGMG
jgi:predicted DNA-binding antitoxin AbrB/MazE fold protein